MLAPSEADRSLDRCLFRFVQDWVRATEELVDMGRAGISPSARSARQWRLASAAIEETEIDVEDDDFDLASGEGSWIEE